MRGCKGTLQETFRTLLGCKGTHQETFRTLQGCKGTLRDTLNSLQNYPPQILKKYRRKNGGGDVVTQNL